MQALASTAPCRRQSGLTLIESLVTLAVSAVVAGTTVPSFQSAVERHQLEGAAAQLETDLALARSAAVAANRTLRISFENSAAGSCYIIHSGTVANCTCSGPATPTCTAPAQAWRSVQFAADDAVQLQANVRSMVLDPDKGTVSPTGTLRLVGRHGQGVNVVVNIMGRARQCTPTPPLLGFRAC